VDKFDRDVYLKAITGGIAGLLLGLLTVFLLETFVV